MNKVIRITFDHPMDPVNLLDKLNYHITGPGQESAPIVIDHVEFLSDSIVDLYFTSSVKVGEDNYQITMTSITDIDGDLIDSSFDNILCSGIEIKPQIVSITSIDAYTIVIVFDTDMDPDTSQNIDNYNMDPLIISSAVLQLDGRTVILTTSFQENQPYTLVITGILDSAGNPIDPIFSQGEVKGGISLRVLSAITIDNDTIEITFNAEVKEDTALIEENYTIYVFPTVRSATYINSTQCKVVFSEPMDLTTAQTITNYELLGSTSPNVIGATHVAGITTLDLDAPMVNREYIVRVTGVTDLTGLMVNPNLSTATFIYDL